MSIQFMPSLCIQWYIAANNFRLFPKSHTQIFHVRYSHVEFVLKFVDIISVKLDVLCHLPSLLVWAQSVKRKSES